MISAGNFVIENLLQPVIDIKLAGTDSNDFYTAKALLDTGTMKSGISDSFVEKLGLVPCGAATLSSAVSKNKKVRLFKTKIRFPFMYEFPEVPVAELKNCSKKGFDFVIGMDIISYGDMLITNTDGKMMISLRFPSADERQLFPKY